MAAAAVSRGLRDVRIAMIVPSLRGGGLERVVTDLTLSLKEHGMLPAVFAVDGLGVHAERLEASGVACIDCRETGPRLRGINWRLIAALRRFGADILHAHSGTWMPAAMSRTLLGIPLVFTDHGRYPPEPLGRAIVERWFARQTDALLAVSGAAGDYVRDYLGLAERPQVIENGIDLAPYRAARRERGAMRASWGARDDDVVLMALGRLAPVKNHALLLAGFAKALAAAPRLLLVIVGRGELEVALRTQAAQLGIEDRVRFLGYRTDVAACLAGADVLVNTSTTEGLPISVLEAMAAGCAIVATAVGGVPETLGSPPAGLLVPSGDATALAHALADVGTNDASRTTLASAAGTRVESYSLERCTRRHMDLYASLLPESAR